MEQRQLKKRLFHGTYILALGGTTIYLPSSETFCSRQIVRDEPQKVLGGLVVEEEEAGQAR